MITKIDVENNEVTISVPNLQNVLILAQNVADQVKAASDGNIDGDVRQLSSRIRDVVSESTVVGLREDATYEEINQHREEVEKCIDLLCTYCTYENLKSS